MFSVLKHVNRQRDTYFTSLSSCKDRMKKIELKFWAVFHKADRDRWRTLVSAVMNLRFPWNAGNFLTSCKPVSFSRRTLHHGVSKSSQSGALYFADGQYHILPIYSYWWFCRVDFWFLLSLLCKCPYIVSTFQRQYDRLSFSPSHSTKSIHSKKWSLKTFHGLKALK